MVGRRSEWRTWLVSIKSRITRDPSERRVPNVKRLQCDIAGPVKDKRMSFCEYQRGMLAQLLDSEKDFISSMTDYLDGYAVPLQQATFLEPNDKKLLIGHMGQLLDLHKRIYAELEECSGTSEPTTAVGRLFHDLVDDYRDIYLVFVEDCSYAVDVIMRYSEDDRFRFFMQGKGLPSSQNPALALVQYLNKPLQRCMRYSIMLKELSECSSDAVPDLQNAILQFSDLSSALSDMKKRKDQEIQLLQSKIEGWEGTDISTLGDLMMKSNILIWSKKAIKERILLLFETTLVLISKSPPKSKFDYYFKERVALDNISMLSRLDDNENYQNAFEVEVASDRKKNIVVSATTYTEREAWMNAINQQVAFERANKSSPVEEKYKVRKGLFARKKEKKDNSIRNAHSSTGAILSGSSTGSDLLNPRSEDRVRSLSNSMLSPKDEKVQSFKVKKATTIVEEAPHDDSYYINAPVTPVTIASVVQAASPSDKNEQYNVPSYAHIVSIVETLKQHVNLISEELADVKARLLDEREQRKMLEARLLTH